MHTVSDIQPTTWAYAEQALTPSLTLLAAYGHAFGSDNFCDNFYGIGGTYTLKRAELGLFSDYTRVLDLDEWTTELVCSFHLNDFFTAKPVLHIITTDGSTKCVAMLLVNVAF